MQLPVRVSTSLLATLRDDAESVGQPLSDRVRELLNVGLVMLGKIDEAEPLPPCTPPIPTPMPGRPHLDLLERRDKTDRIDLRPGAPVCTCDKPTLSKYAPFCTTCQRARR